MPEGGGGPGDGEGQALEQEHRRKGFSGLLSSLAPEVLPGAKAEHLSICLGPRSCFHLTLGVKNLPANAGDAGLIPGSGRSSGVRNGNPLQYSCLEDPLDRGAWRATVYGVPHSQSQTRLS